MAYYLSLLFAGHVTRADTGGNAQRATRNNNRRYIPKSRIYETQPQLCPFKCYLLYLSLKDWAKLTRTPSMAYNT